MKGVSDAETICFGLLDESLLSRRGTLEELSIFISEYDLPLLHTLRVISQLCGPSPLFYVGPNETTEEVSERLKHDQTEYIRYLRKLVYLALLALLSRLTIT
jgi:hypothetical protein